MLMLWLYACSGTVPDAAAVLPAVWLLRLWLCGCCGFTLAAMALCRLWLCKCRLWLWPECLYLCLLWWSCYG